MVSELEIIIKQMIAKAERLVAQSSNKVHDSHKTAHAKYLKDLETNPNDAYTLWEFSADDSKDWFKCYSPPLWLEGMRYRHINPQGPIRPLSEYEPMFVLLRETPEGNWEGYCENSFSMDWMKSSAYVYWTGTAYSFLGTHELDGEKDSNKAYENALTYWKRNDNGWKELAYRLIRYQPMLDRIKDTAKRAKISMTIKLAQTRYIEKHFKVKVFSVNDPNLPVTLDLNAWTAARSNRDASKFVCRNATMRAKVQQTAEVIANDTHNL